MRLIDADAILYWQDDSGIKSMGYVRKGQIDSMPTIEAEPIKHGRWIRRKKLVPLPLDTEPLDYNDYDEETHSEWISYWYCSECDYELGTFLSSDNYYCKCCGADMREAERK